MKTTDQIEQEIGFSSDEATRDFKRLIDEAVADLGGLEAVQKIRSSMKLGTFSEGFSEKLCSLESDQIIAAYFDKWLARRTDKTFNIAINFFFLKRKEGKKVQRESDFTVDYDCCSTWARSVPFVIYGVSSGDSVETIRCSRAELVEMLFGAFAKNYTPYNPKFTKFISRKRFSVWFNEEYPLNAEFSRTLKYIMPWAFLEEKEEENQ